MHTAVACVRKCFTLTGGLKSDKCDCLWNSPEHTAQAVTCRGKIYLSKVKIVKSLHHYVLCQWKRLWVCIYAHCSSMRSQMLYPNRRFEIWQVRMFVREILAGEKYIFPKAKIVKSLHHCVVSQWKRLWVCIYVHCSSMRSEMFYPNRRFEIWQVRMFVKQRKLPSANVCEAGLIA